MTRRVKEKNKGISGTSEEEGGLCGKGRGLEGGGGRGYYTGTAEEAQPEPGKEEEEGEEEDITGRTWNRW